ncbi:hypothetical protein ABIA32_003264 [Streptacidiphilus sp. MAP12-20]|uniref:hypothetical protein n=1 Tax=Streptacidiphilus sp. MAP12-20 TaxID=3156299 RepID=UPI003512D9EB
MPIDAYFIPYSLLWKRHEADRLANNPQRMLPRSTADLDTLATARGAEPYEINGVKAFITKASATVKITNLEVPHAQYLTSDFKIVIPAGLEWLSQHLAAPTAG